MESDLTRGQAVLLAGLVVGSAVTGASVAESVGARSGAHTTGTRFDLAGRFPVLLSQVTLPHSTVMQSFAVDSTHRRVYVVQQMHGGLRLPGERTPRTREERAVAGDLCISRLSLSGAHLGHMYVKGAGHGGAVGAEPVADGTDLWIEADAQRHGRASWGRRLTRLTFRAGSVLTPDSSSARTYTLVPGARLVTASVDPRSGTLVQRCELGGVTQYRMYDLHALRRGRIRALAAVRQPREVMQGRPFQGFTHWGGHLYVLEGGAYGTGDSRAPVGNAHVTCIDLADGHLVDRQRITVAPGMVRREPEGLGIHLTDPTDPRSARLCLGFASGPAGAPRANIYSTGDTLG